MLRARAAAPLGLAGLRRHHVLMPMPPVRQRESQVCHGTDNLFSVDAVKRSLQKKRFESHTVQRIYEADVHPGE